MKQFGVRGELLFTTAKGVGGQAERYDWNGVCARPRAQQRSTDDMLQCASVTITHPVFFFFFFGLE